MFSSLDKIVTSGAQSPDRIATFAALVRMRFDEAASHAVSPAVLIASDGAVVGFARLSDTPTEPDTPRSGWFRRWFGTT